MHHYEVIFEDGDHSILAAEDDAEVLRFAKEQHQRAKSGLPGGPAGHRATRVAKILKYDAHPVDLTPDGYSVDELASNLKAVADDNGVVSTHQLQALAKRPALVNSGPHESNFQAKESGELDPADWEGEV